MGNKKRNILIGLDGVPHHLIERYTLKGIMPNLKSFVNENTFLKMNSSVPDVSSVAWSSIITGKNPGEHGIFGFMDVNPKNYSLYFPESGDLKAPPFWTRFRKSVVINVPSTYPAQPMNGLMVSGFVSIDLEGAVYPKSLIPDLQEIGYKIDVNNSLARESPRGFIDDLHKTLEIRLKFLEKIWDKDDFDLFLFVITGTDRLNLFFFDAFDNVSSPYKATLEEYYNLVDRAIGRILSRVSEDDNVMIFSETGHEKLEVEFYVNRFLADKGYIKYKNDDPKTPADLDITTRAFALDPGRIYINSSDNFLFGHVKPADKDNLMMELQILFRNLEIDGRKMIKKIVRGANEYTGPYVKKGPDIILIPEKGVELKARISNPKLTDKRIFNGKHTADNAFIAFTNKNNRVIKEPFKVERVAELLID